MGRVLSVGLEAAVARRGTEPGWLIEIAASAGTLRYSTRGTLEYDGYTWVGGAGLSGVGLSGGVDASATLTLPNADNAASALALSDLLRDTPVTIYAYHGDARYETELLTNPNLLSGSGWFWAATTVSANTEDDPIGTATAAIIRETAAIGNFYHYVNQTVYTVEDNEVYTASVSLKAGARRYGMLQLISKIPDYNRQIRVDLNDGSIYSVGSPLLGYSCTEEVGGWWRLSITASVASGGPAAGVYIWVIDDAKAISYQGVVQDSLYVYNASLRRGTAAAYAEEINTLYVDEVNSVAPLRVEFTLASISAGSSRIPDVLIGPPLCNHIPPAGTEIRWGGTTLVLERKDG